MDNTDIFRYNFRTIGPVLIEHNIQRRLGRLSGWVATSASPEADHTSSILQGYVVAINKPGYTLSLIIFYLIFRQLLWESFTFLLTGLIKLIFVCYGCWLPAPLIGVSLSFRKLKQWTMVRLTTQSCQKRFILMCVWGWQTWFFFNWLPFTYYFVFETFMLHETINCFVYINT